MCRHPFDSTKWRRVCKFLVSDGFLEEKSIVEPLEASNSDLLVVLLTSLLDGVKTIHRVDQLSLILMYHHQVHSLNYLNSLKSSATVARITEVIDSLSPFNLIYFVFFFVELNFFYVYDDRFHQLLCSQTFLCSRRFLDRSGSRLAGRSWRLSLRWNVDGR